MKVTLHAASSRLNEISTGLKFSLLDNKLCGVHPPVQCKDYLVDVFWWERTKGGGSIYGFDWTHGHYDITATYFHLAVHCTNKPLDKCRGGVERFLNAFERGLVFQKTEVTSPEEKMLVFRFHKAWVGKPILFSAYLQLIRLGLYYEGPDPIKFLEGKPAFFAQGTEASRLGNLRPKLHSLLKGNIPKQTWEQYTKVYDLHNTSGLHDYETRY